MSVELEFVDTNVLVYAHDRSAGEKRAAAAALIDRLLDEHGGCLSVQVLTELAVTLTRKLPDPLSPEETAEIVGDFATWTVFAPGAGDVLDAIALSRRYQISLWDALILHAAGSLDASVLWSEDLSHGQRYGEVEVRNPFV